MVSVPYSPYSERRHRLRGDELEPVREAVHRDLLRRIEDHDDLLVTASLFRAWFRMEVYCRNKPKYPLHESWEQMEAYLGFGTVTQPIEELIDVVAEEGSP